jgi:hypothetical protein
VGTPGDAGSASPTTTFEGNDVAATRWTIGLTAVGSVLVIVAVFAPPVGLPVLGAVLTDAAALTGAVGGLAVTGAYLNDPKEQEPPIDWGDAVLREVIDGQGSQ